MNSYNGIALVTLVILLLQVGCGSNHIRNGISPSFIKGLDAIERKDFAEASYQFAELAKEGNPSAMNNLGVSLLMVDRKDEALYWFKKASRYGDPNAKLTLKAMGENIPPSDLVGQHPTHLQQEAANKIILATLLGITVGVSAYYVSNQADIKHNYYHLNNEFKYQTHSFSTGITRDSPSSGSSWVRGALQMAPDGSWVDGAPRMAPDGSWVSGSPRIAPDGSWVGGTPRMAPDGSWVGGTPRMAPDGSWVGGSPRMTPDGSWIGEKP